MKKLLIACALSLLVVSANAENVVNPWYVGASYGQSDIDTGLSSSGTASLDEKGDGYKIYAGYNFNKYIASELFYTDLGDVSYNDSSNTDSAKANPKSHGLAVVLSLPLHKHIVPFVKAGIQRWETNDSVTGAIALDIDEDGTDPMYGFGINFPITDYLTFRTEYEVYEFEKYDYKFLSAGLIYKF